MIVDSVLAPAGGRRPVGAASVTGIGNFLLAAAPIHPGRDRATPTTPFEIYGATQVWHSSARYAQFRAPAFPSSLPCRSRCRALAGLVRAQTSDDIQPRALCTPPPKSFARFPGPCIQPMLPRGSRCGQYLSRPEYTSRPIVTFAPQHTCALCILDAQKSPLSTRNTVAMAKGAGKKLAKEVLENLDWDHRSCAQKELECQQSLLSPPSLPSPAPL